MAMLELIMELNSTLTKKRTELAKKEEEFAALEKPLRKGEKFNNPTVEPIRNDIIQLLKEIEALGQQISIKYLTLAAETTNRFEEENLVKTASEFAKQASEAKQKVYYYSTLV